MSNPAAVIALSYDGTDIQRSDFGIFLEIVRGLNEPPQVRGIDTVIPSRAGRVARNRVADVLTIELRGFVTGRGTAATAAETVAGANTTLTADVAAGASVIVVASATAISVGNLLRIGDTGETEIREVASLVGTTVTLTAPLVSRHDSADTVREVDSVGSTGDRAAFRANVAIVRALFLPTRSPAVLVASLEDGTTATISARGLPTQMWGDEPKVPEIATVSIELESVDPDWVIT